MSYCTGSSPSIRCVSSEHRITLYQKNNITVVVLCSEERLREPILQRRKSRLREVTLLAQGHRADWLLYIETFLDNI